MNSHAHTQGANDARVTRVPSREEPLRGVSRSPVYLRFRVHIEQCTLFERVDGRFSERLMLVEGPIGRVLQLELVLHLSAKVHLDEQRAEKQW